MNDGAVARAARGVVGSSSLEVLQRCGDVAPRDAVIGTVAMEWGWNW